MKEQLLTFVDEGVRAEVKEIMGTEIVCRKLTEMGMVKGVKIQVVKNDITGLIIGIGERRVVMAKGMATKVVVLS